MALVKCPECGRENVSDSALACPECGFAIKEYFVKIEEKKELERRQEKEKLEAELRLLEQKRNLEEKKHKKQERIIHAKKNKGKILLGIIAIGILLGILIFMQTDVFKQLTDRKAPELIVNKNEIIWLSEPDLSSDDYVQVVDEIDTNPKLEIIEGSVDSTRNGNYLVKYKVSDQSGNSEIYEVYYEVDSGLPDTISEETLSFYEKLQGIWCAEALWTNNEVKKMIKFEGANYLYRDSNGVEYKGRYTVDKELKPTREDDDCLFGISLSGYTKSPAHLFYYKSFGLSDRFANMEWFEDYSEYRWSHEEMMEGSKQTSSKKVEVTGISSKTSGDNFVISGTVKNTTDKTVYFVKVKVTLQNENGEVINTDNTYAVGDEGLAPGEASTFSCYIDKVDGATHYSAKVYDYQY